MSAPPATHWLIIAYDVPNGPRAEFRDQHLARSKPLHDEGLLQVGGPMLSDDATTMIGSTLIIKADGDFKNLEDLWKFVRSDTYYVNGVFFIYFFMLQWDKERISVHPFFPGGGVTFGRSS